jgi:hypothetical protein
MAILKKSILGGPSIIGFDGKPIPIGGPTSLPTSTGPTFNTNGILNRTPLGTPDTALTQLQKPIIGGTPDLDEYRAYLRSAPKREDYEHGKWGKIAALASGTLAAGAPKSSAREGIEIGLGILDRPYARAKEEYATKGGLLKELSELEYRGLNDAEKKAYQEREFNLKLRDQFIKELKATSDIKLDDARIAEIVDQNQARGWVLQRDDTTGHVKFINPKNKQTWDAGKFGESLGEKRTAEFADFKDREEVKHGFEKALEDMRQRGRLGLEAMKQAGDKSLAALKDKLDTEKGKRDPVKINAAYEGAVGQTLDKNPDLAAALFTTEDGKTTMKPITTRELQAQHAMFVEKVQQNMNAILDYQYAPTDTGNPPFARHPKTGAVVYAKDLQGQESTDPIHAAALKYLRDNDFEETPAAIERAKQLIGDRVVGSQPSHVPQVAPPQMSTSHGPTGSPIANIPNMTTPAPPITPMPSGQPIIPSPQQQPIMGPHAQDLRVPMSVPQFFQPNPQQTGQTLEELQAAWERMQRAFGASPILAR